jgi:hypothetical protein
MNAATPQAPAQNVAACSLSQESIPNASTQRFHPHNSILTYETQPKMLYPCPTNPIQSKPSKKNAKWYLKHSLLTSLRHLPKVMQVPSQISHPIHPFHSSSPPSTITTVLFRFLLSSTTLGFKLCAAGRLLAAFSTCLRALLTLTCLATLTCTICRSNSSGDLTLGYNFLLVGLRWSSVRLRGVGNFTACEVSISHVGSSSSMGG